MQAPSFRILAAPALCCGCNLLRRFGRAISPVLNASYPRLLLVMGEWTGVVPGSWAIEGVVGPEKLLCGELWRDAASSMPSMRLGPCVIAMAWILCVAAANSGRDSSRTVSGLPRSVDGALRGLEAVSVALGGTWPLLRTVVHCADVIWLSEVGIACPRVLSRLARGGRSGGNGAT
jgi:hypothetical protein